MKSLIIIISIATVLFTQTSYARNWDRIKIPGAVCGDGLPYSVFVDKKTENKNLLIEFMGGGACWSVDTCYGLNFRTWFHPIPEVPFFSYMTNDWWGWSTHPFKSDSAVYFPYCTGDVHSADHVATYKGITAHHKGYRNVVLALAYLNENKIIQFDDYKRVAVWGASAGAIATLVHLKNIEPYLSRDSVKLAIADSPGLHFGKTFWYKFTPELFRDYQKNFGSIGLEVSADDGFLIPHIAPVLEGYSKWTLGVMQSTRDQVMSTVFGAISPEEHRDLVLSDRGILAAVKNYKNVYAWVPDSDAHTFLLLKTTSSGISDMNNSQSAINFVRKLVKTAERQPITEEDTAPLTPQEVEHISGL